MFWSIGRSGKRKMDKELRNKISENKILTHSERAKIISDLESYEKLQTNIKKAFEEIESIGMGSYLEFTKEIACNDREVRMSKKFATAVLDKLIGE